MRITRISLTLAAACAAATSALAGDAKLVWNDLDLTTAAGKAELTRRIETAAGQVCAPEAVTGSRIVRRDPSANCLADARSAIAAQIEAKIKHSHRAASTARTSTAYAAR